MHYAITRTHDRGRRLREGERAGPDAQGMLTIEPVPPKHKGAVARMAASVWVPEPDGHRRGLLPPLFEPRVLGLDEDGVLRLVGIEINAEGTDTLDCVQIWECRPLDGRKRSTGGAR